MKRVILPLVRLEAADYIGLPILQNNPNTDTVLQCWVEMIQEDETATLMYFATIEGFQQAMITTKGAAYSDFWNWINTPAERLF